MIFSLKPPLISAGISERRATGRFPAPEPASYGRSRSPVQAAIKHLPGWKYPQLMGKTMGL